MINYNTYSYKVKNALKGIKVQEDVTNIVNDKSQVGVQNPILLFFLKDNATIMYHTQAIKNLNLIT
jgi:hypothetical protein